MRKNLNRGLHGFHGWGRDKGELSVIGYRLLACLVTINCFLITPTIGRSENVNLVDHQLKTTKPLPVTVVATAAATGAATAALQTTGNTALASILTAVTAATPAGENHIGEVGGHTDVITVTPTVSTSPAYTANDVVGGKQTLTNAMRVSGGTGILQSMCIIDKSNQKVALEVLIFDSDPSSGTYTDNGAFSWNATDGAKLIRRISIAASDYATFGTAAVADVSPGGKVLKASGSRNLYAVIVTTGTPTYAATTDLIVRFGILQD